MSKPRNWHALNAIQRHAGPMHDKKRSARDEQIARDIDMIQENLIVCIDCQSLEERSIGDARRCERCDDARGERLFAEDAPILLAAGARMENDPE